VRFELLIGGYGIYFAGLNVYDLMTDSFIILSWSIMVKHRVWRGESHVRMDGHYRFRRYKNGKTVEEMTFRNPVVTL
jgi:hypothetical protein